MKWLKLLTGAVSPITALGGTFVKKFFASKDLQTKTVADWEHEAIRASKGSWKDEFLTLVFASPIVLQVIGAVVYSFTDDDKLLRAADSIYQSFANVGLDYTQVMLLIISASFGVHVTRTIGKTKLTKAAGEIAKAKSQPPIQEHDR